MGLLISGEWHHRDDRRANEKGEFVRNESPYRDFIGNENSRFAAEANRYHLFVNAGCPWAYRTILYLAIKNLSHLISISYTEPAMGQEGWTFGDDREALLDAQHLHDVYTADDSNFTGRSTVPVLWDKKNHVIVNNESADIIRMFNSAFTGFDGVYDTDYYPANKAVEIDKGIGVNATHLTLAVLPWYFPTSRQPTFGLGSHDGTTVTHRVSRGILPRYL